MKMWRSFPSRKGNHEDGMGEGHVHYKERYPMKFAAQASGSSNPLFWSRNLGPLHVISLNSYAQSHPSSSMHRWLKKDLASFNRSKTPWLVVMMHSPWYNSNKGHIGESIPMKGHMESLFYDHGVNVVLSGHVHSYERTKNIYQNDTNPCGPVYLNLGDGGNREGPYTNWLPGSTPGSRRPSWTAFRQGSFGVAELEVANSTHAKFKCHGKEGSACLLSRFIECWKWCIYTVCMLSSTISLPQLFIFFGFWPINSNTLMFSQMALTNPETPWREAVSFIQGGRAWPVSITTWWWTPTVALKEIPPWMRCRR